MTTTQHLIFSPQKLKKILNIALDTNCSNSAATVKLVTDLEVKSGPFPKNNVYREIFEEFYDFSDASNYKLTTRVEGITFTGTNPNITFPQRTITHVQEGGLRLLNQTLDLSLFSKMNFTICVVMVIWLKRSMSIKTDINKGTYEKPHLILHTTKSLKLQTTGYDETTITAPNSFNGKRVVFWLTKQGRPSPVVKASISNYSFTLTQRSNLAAMNDYKFKIFSEDTVIHKGMYSPNFYDFDPKQYHKIMIQEKLNGSYIL